MRTVAAAVVLNGIVGWTAAAADAGACMPHGDSAFVSAINDRAEIVLQDGRTLALAGVDVARATADHPLLGQLPRRTLETWIAGHAVQVEPLAATPDRWGRIVANVFAPADFSTTSGDPAKADEPDVSVAFVLVDAGLARAKPDADRPACVHELIAAEAAARQANLGLWIDASYAVIPADDELRLAQHGGTFVIVEGQVTRVGHGRARTFLDFGPTRDSFTAVLADRGRGRTNKAVPQPDDLKGVRVRIRGTLDIRFGPRIEVIDPDEIERL